MYTDEDLAQAVKKGIFSADSVEAFRSDYLDRHNTHTADEENFRLVGSFNDIFVVIAVGLLLLSLGWATYAVSPFLSAASVALVSWGLAEFFVLNRKMALPAIALLVSFVGAVFAAVVTLFAFPGENALTMAGLAATMAAWLHWKRFRVPITVAAGASALVVFVVSLMISVFPVAKDYLVYLLFIGGVAVFALAMHWDSSDLERVSGKSDVAFWLHLVSAPLLVHPIFTGLGIFEGNESTLGLVSIILLYLFLTFVSVVIDRRAFMVSALVYVLVALTELLDDYGLAGDGFAYVGVLIGFSLLLLSGFWHKARLQLVRLLPQSIQIKVPAAK
ncbi:MAG: hypothetical protein ACRBB4_00155 [Neptuniibacter sp.]